MRVMVYLKIRYNCNMAILIFVYRTNMMNHDEQVDFRAVYGGFHKWGYPPIIHFNGMFPYKSSVLGVPPF